MATQKQIDANRRNAQRSTGPRTAEGKARASRNRRTHGLYGVPPYPEQDDPEFVHNLEVYREAYPPHTVVAQRLVIKVALGYWRMDQVDRADYEVWSGLHEEEHSADPQVRAQAHANFCSGLDGILRLNGRADRTLWPALDALNDHFATDLESLAEVRRQFDGDDDDDDLSEDDEEAEAPLTPAARIRETKALEAFLRKTIRTHFRPGRRTVTLPTSAETIQTQLAQ